jgi:hypothetical protein
MLLYSIVKSKYTFGNKYRIAAILLGWDFWLGGVESNPLHNLQIFLYRNIQKPQIVADDIRLH